MSDHADSPTADANPMLDIGGLFAFSGERGLVLAISVNPLSDPSTTDRLKLDCDGLYEFKIDTDGDAVADLCHRLVVAGSGPSQQMTLLRATGPDAIPGDKSSDMARHGMTNLGANISVTEVADGTRLFVGPRQDPFFFNFVGVDSPLANTFSAALNGDGLHNEGSSDNTFRPPTSPQSCSRFRCPSHRLRSGPQPRTKVTESIAPVDS